jgi:hypothetical protein
MSHDSLVLVFHDKKLYRFERAERLSGSHFGGPLEAEFSGEPFGPKPLHLIARLGSLHISALSQFYLSQMPLVFGMHYDGCELVYHIESERKIEILRIAPSTSLDDWPYTNFPPLIPYYPLRLSDSPRSESYDSFAQRFPNMPWPQPTEMVVCVPPPATIGLSFWGGGDWNDVTIVFECDLQKSNVKTYTLIS